MVFLKRYTRNLTIIQYQVSQEDILKHFGMFMSAVCQVDLLDYEQLNPPQNRLNIELKWDQVGSNTGAPASGASDLRP